MADLGGGGFVEIMFYEIMLQRYTQNDHLSTLNFNFNSRRGGGGGVYS